MKTNQSPHSEMAKAAAAPSLPIPSITPSSSFLHNRASFPLAPSRSPGRGNPRGLRAGLGGGQRETKKAEKKFITKEEEPEQYWQTAGEKEGENPMQTPLPYILIFSMSTPFIILAIAFANGWIKVPIR